MATRAIKVTGVADFSSITKEVQSLSKTISNAFGKGVQPIDKESLAILKRESESILTNLGKKISDLKRETEGYKNALKTANAGQQAELNNKVLENTKKVVALEKERASLTKAQHVLETGKTPEQQARAKATVERQLAKERLAEEKSAKKAQAEMEKAALAEQKERERTAAAEEKSQKKAALAAEAEQLRTAERQKREVLRQQAEDERKASLEKKRKEAEARKAARADEMLQRRATHFAFSGVGGAIGEATKPLGVVGHGVDIAGGAIKAGMGAGEAGMGPAGVMALGGLALAAGAAAFAISRMKAGFDAFQEIIPNVIQLGGMGVGAVHGLRDRAVKFGAQLGFQEPEIISMQLATNRAFGKAASPREDENRLMKIMGAARGLGLSPQEILSGGNQLRALGGTDVAQKQLGNILARAFASGMDKTQASAYLASTVGLLTQINNEGIGNTNQILGVMTGLVARSQMSPEQAARSLGGLNAAIAGSSGEANAFFQMGAARGGLGGGTLLGTQFAVRQGLMGLDAGQFQKQVGGTSFGRMGVETAQALGLTDPNFSRKMATGIIQQLHTQFSGNTMSSRVGMFGFMQQMFGAKTFSEATKALSLLERISTSSERGTTESLTKELQDLGKDPSEAWRGQVLTELQSVNKNLGLLQTALITAQTEARAKDTQIGLGEQTAPVFNKLTDTLTHLDATLANLSSEINSKGFWNTVVDLEERLHQAALQLVLDIGDGLKNALGSLLGISPESIKGGTNGPVPDKLGDQDRAAVEKFFGAPVVNSQASTVGPPTPPAVVVKDEHGQAIVNEIRGLRSDIKGRPAAAPRAGRELSK